MDLNNILGWSITILAIAGLVVYIRIRSRNRKKRAFSVLESFARERNCTIATYDHWDKTLIGIDKKATNKLFFIRSLPAKEIRMSLDLSEIIDCRMVITERKIKFKKDTVNVIDRIEVVFSPYNQKPDIVLEFYNTDYDHLTLSGELQLAQKWTGMLKSIIYANHSRNVIDKKKIQVSPSIHQPKVRLSKAEIRERNKPEIHFIPKQRVTKVRSNLHSGKHSY